MIDGAFRFLTLGLGLSTGGIAALPLALAAVDQPWLTQSGSLNLLEPVLALASSPYILPAFVGTCGAALGTWTTWLLIRLEAPARRDSSAAALAEKMREVLGRMRQVSESCHRSQFEIASMVLVYTDFQALQLSMQRLGFRVPWLYWEPGDDPVDYLTTNIGYLAYMEPLVRHGHLQSAKRAAIKIFDWRRTPQAPVLKIGNALKRAF